MALRILAGTLALALMIGELWRSWGVGRPIAFVLDDQLIGGLLLVAAILMGTPTARRRALFVAGWAACAGMLYGSFFSKVYSPATEQGGNWDLGILTGLIGLAFVTSLFGLFASLISIPQKGASYA